MSNDFTVAQLVELLDKHNILTLEDLKDVLGDEKKATWTEFKALLEAYEKKQRKLTISDLRAMTDDAHVMIPEPDVDPPQSG